MRRRPLLTGLLPAVLAPMRQAGAAAPAKLAESAPGDPPLPIGVDHRALRFPADHAAHPDTRVEWWYITGCLRAGTDTASTRTPDFGFQVTFFRTRTGLAESSASRFAARQLVFAHVALTDLAAGARPGSGGMMHDQRAGREGFGFVQTPVAEGTQALQLRDWSLRRAADPPSPSGASPATRLSVIVRTDRFALDLDLGGTQPLLLQGDAGYSQKGPEPRQASRYYSEPQLAVRGRVERGTSAPRDVTGRAWLDHEWSNDLMPSAAVGWDWVGFNLMDGGALMAFRLRRADGSALWAGGSHRNAAGELRNFNADVVHFEPLRHWRSPRTGVAYPVEWRLDTPAGHWRVTALQDDQELDSRSSTGSVYWEGISALTREDGAAVGWGYLELTGYAGPLRL